MTRSKSPTLLVILDGYGIAPPSKYNAITLAKKPTLDRLFELYPNALLGAAGKDVGLEPGKMGSSEAGHMNIGAGRIASQDSLFITRSIRDRSFFENPALTGAVRHIKKNNSRLHVMGLMGDSDSPHSDPEHFRAVLRLARDNGVYEVYCHLFTDGRDSSPRTAQKHLSHFKKIIKDEGIGKIATLSGRYYAMDRAKNWFRLMKAYNAIVYANGKKAQTPEEAIENAYREGLSDENLMPTVMIENKRPVAKIKKDDSIVFFNLRSDRARQFTKLFVDCNRDWAMKDKMPEYKKPGNLYFVAMTNFGPDLDVHTAFPETPLLSTLPMALSHTRQMYITESEKYAHVTYFLNGGYADPVGGEDRVMIESPKVDSYAKKPEMSAAEITKRIQKSLRESSYDFITVNYPNPDMVGHTGDLKATIRAIETVDEQIKILLRDMTRLGGSLIITADHGNAEKMYDEKDRQPDTYHTKNPVPFLLVGSNHKNVRLVPEGVLGNIAPTVLDVMGIEKPKLMTKDSLIVG